jgi:hypothetical protein
MPEPRTATYRCSELRDQGGGYGGLPQYARLTMESAAEAWRAAGPVPDVIGVFCERGFLVLNGRYRLTLEVVAPTAATPAPSK